MTFSTPPAVVACHANAEGASARKEPHRATTVAATWTRRDTRTPQGLEQRQHATVGATSTPQPRSKRNSLNAKTRRCCVAHALRSSAIRGRPQLECSKGAHAPTSAPPPRSAPPTNCSAAGRRSWAPALSRRHPAPGPGNAAAQRLMVPADAPASVSARSGSRSHRPYLACFRVQRR